MKNKFTFDTYLADVLNRVTFITGGEFKASDVKQYLEDRDGQSEALAKLYHNEYAAQWSWCSFNDRMHRHINRVINYMGGSRTKVNHKWVYRVKSDMFDEMKLKAQASSPFNDGWTKQHYENELHKLNKQTEAAS